MANRSLDQLDAISDLDDDDVLFIMEDGEPKQVTVAQLRTALHQDPILARFGTPTTAWEFNSADLTGLTAVGSLTEEDANSTLKGHYFGRLSNSSMHFAGRYAVPPSPPWTALAKFSGDNSRATLNKVGVFVGPDNDGPWDFMHVGNVNRTLDCHVVTNTGSLGASFLTDVITPVGGEYIMVVQARSATEVDMSIALGNVAQGHHVSFGRNPGVGVVGFGVIDDEFGVAFLLDWFRIYNSVIDFN